MASQMPNPAAPIGSPAYARAAKPAAWFDVVTNGRMDRSMPYFNQSLTGQQRWDVLAYVFSLSTTPNALQQGSASYEANCASCHGAQGKGDGPQAGATKPQDLSDPAWQSETAGNDIFQAITSGKGGMPAFSAKLSEDQRWALADYVRSMENASPMLAAAGTPGTGVAPQATGAASGVGEQNTGQATPAGTAASGAVGTISGQVKNGSGDATPAGLQVTLHGYDSLQETITQVTTADGQGKYSFAGVEEPSGRVFMVSVSYKNTVFNSDIVPVQAGSAATDLPVTIYEPTTDTSALSVDRLHVFFDFSNTGAVQVVQLYVISNSGNKAVVSAGAGKPIMQFALPKGATNLQFQQGSLGGRYVATENGFGDTQSIPPGTDQGQLLFYFNLPYDKKADIALPVTMAVKSVVLMVPKGGVQVQGANIQDGGDQNVQGVTFHLYNAENLAAGSTLAFTLSGTPSTVTTTGLINGGSLLTIEIGLTVFVLALGAAFFWLRRASRRALKADGAPVPAAGTNGKAGGEEPETLMDAIIALDDLYQAGKLPETAYRERRAELKARLAEQMGEA
jgi:cytochrome c553